MSLIFAIAPVRAQQTVNLPQRVIEAKQTDYVYTQNPGTPQVIQIKSANESVATAGAYGVGGVQIVAVSPGKTMVEFFDNDARVLYRLPVWVTAPNPTGAGNSGYDPQRIQLEQIVMRPRTTQNVAVPGGGVPQISGVTSSNKGVATARTNTVNTIQIYSYATNGDTFINLTDSATNRNFQVHVYVRDNAPGPVGGPVGGRSGTNRATAGPNGDGNIDLPQIVMLKGNTQNVSTQNSGQSQIVKLDSSNTGVATVSEVGSNTIQIYAVALGDSWVTFFDAATRTTYRVHVWVIKPGGPMPPPDPGPKPAPKPKPTPTPKPGPGSKSKIDPCLVGTWRSEPSGEDTDGTFENSRGINFENGGLILTVEANGMATFNYDGLKPTNKTDQFGGRHTYTVTGKATGQISIDENHSINLYSDWTSNVTEKVSGPDGPPREAQNNRFWPSGDQGTFYTCNADSLLLFRTMRFKKVE